MQQLTEDNKDLKLLPLQIIFVLAIFQFVISFLTEPMMLTFDESMWQYIGRNWIRNGLVPYSGGIDNKSPFIFLVFGISDKLFWSQLLVSQISGNCSPVGRDIRTL